jgi:hypothetical protein
MLFRRKKHALLIFRTDWTMGQRSGSNLCSIHLKLLLLLVDLLTLLLNDLLPGPGPYELPTGLVRYPSVLLKEFHAFYIVCSSTEQHIWALTAFHAVKVISSYAGCSFNCICCS